jgi:hypothetical protein
VTPSTGSSTNAACKVKPPAVCPLVDIQDFDYEQRRHASDLAAWVNAKFRDLEAGGRLEEQYFERLGRNVKRLVEEAVPLSRLGLYLWTPGNEPYLSCLPLNQSVDAIVEVQGFAARLFKVEVTTLETNETTMRRQALAREGTVSLTGPVRREGRSIIADPRMIDVAEQQEIVTDRAFARLLDKAESGRYDKETAILVYLSEFWPLPPEGRLGLLRRTRRYLEIESQVISNVYYCYWPDYSIDAVEVRAR